MILRTPGFKDYDRIMDLLIDMANASDVFCYYNPSYKDKYIRNMITEFCRNGVFIVAEDGGEIQGLIAGMIQPQIWLPHVNLLVETAFYITPEYRDTSLGARLFKAYTKAGEQLIEQGHIDNFCITQNPAFTDFDYSKHGFDMMETTFMWSKA